MNTLKNVTINALGTGCCGLAISTPALNLLDKNSFWFLPFGILFLVGALAIAIGILGVFACGVCELAKPRDAAS